MEPPQNFSTYFFVSIYLPESQKLPESINLPETLIHRATLNDIIRSASADAKILLSG